MTKYKTSFKTEKELIEYLLDLQSKSYNQGVVSGEEHQTPSSETKALIRNLNFKVSWIIIINCLVFVLAVSVIFLLMSFLDGIKELVVAEVISRINELEFIDG